MNDEKQFLLKQIQDSETIQHILSIEPAFGRVLDLAVHPAFPGSRWVAYESLKWMGMSLVGYSARQEALRTSVHYDAMISAIDRLLPEGWEEEMEYHAEYEDRWKVAIEAFEEGRSPGMNSLKAILLEEGA